MTVAAPVAERLRALFLNRAIISPLCLGSSPALATCETSQVLLVGVPGGFSRGSLVFAHLLIGPSHMSLNNLERDVKLNKKMTVPLLFIYFYFAFFIIKFY